MRVLHIRLTIVKSVQQYQDNGWYSIDATLYDGSQWVTLTGSDFSTLVVNKPDDSTDDDKTPTVSDCTLRIENTETGILCTPSHSSTCNSSSVFIDGVEHSFSDARTYLFTDAVDGQTYKIYLKCTHIKDGQTIIRTGRTTTWTYHKSGDSGGEQPLPPDNTSDSDSDSNSIWDSIGKLLKTILDAISAIVSPLLDGITTLIESIINSLTKVVSLTTNFGEFLSAAFVFIPSEFMSIITLGISLAILAIILRILKG